MAANLMSVVMQFLTPDMMAKIASFLGIDRSIAQKAIGGAVPALLSTLAARSGCCLNRISITNRALALVSVSQKPGFMPESRLIKQVPCTGLSVVMRVLCPNLYR